MFELHENCQLESQFKESELELSDTLHNWRMEDFEDILPGQERAGEDFQWEGTGSDEFVLED